MGLGIYRNRPGSNLDKAYRLRFKVQERSKGVSLSHVSSFRRKAEYRFFKVFWTPVFAGVTVWEGFSGHPLCR